MPGSMLLQEEGEHHAEHHPVLDVSAGAAAYPYPTADPSTGEAYDDDTTAEPGAEAEAEDDEASGPKLPRPCVGCRTSKVLCDRHDPCKRCVRLGMECTIP